MTESTGYVTGVDHGAHLADPPQQQDWNGVILYGQSLTTGLKALPVQTVTAPVATNLTFGSGPKSTAPGHVGDNDSPGTTTSKALCEDHRGNDDDHGGETMCSTIGAVALCLSGLAPASFVIFASCAGHAGYRIVQLGSSAAWYDNFVSHVSGAKALADAAGQTYAVQAVCWVQGSSDSRESVTRADYLSALLDLVGDINTDVAGITGQTAPVHLLLAQIAQVQGGSSPEVALAQLDAVAASPLVHLVTSVAPFDTVEGLHWSATGQIHAGHYFGRAFHQLVNLGRTPDAIMPVGAKANGVNLKVRLRTPTDLQFTTTSQWTTNQRGFRVFDNAGDVSLSSFAAAGDTVSMVLGRELGAGATLKYGLDYLPDHMTAQPLQDGAFGDVRDSQTLTTTIGGVDWPLCHFAPAFQIPITVV